MNLINTDNLHEQNDIDKITEDKTFDDVPVTIELDSGICVYLY